MKKILVVTPFFYPHVGGSQQYMEDLYATVLLKHDDIMVDVLCYNTDHADGEEVYRRMHVYRIPGLSLLPGQFALPNPLKLIAFLWQKRKKYDLIHVSTRFFETAWWAPFYAKLMKTPVLLTDHCAYHPVHTNAAVRAIAKGIDVFFIPLILKRYTAVFSTNKATQTFLRTHLHTESSVLYGGVDMQKFTLSKNDHIREKKRVTITYVGRMIESKGVLFLFNVATRHPEFDFVFAGPGALYTQLQEVVTKNAYSHIQLLGSLKKDDVVKLLARSDIFVHPSYHHEGFPNSLLEAGAMGLPVIATDVGGTTELIIDGQTGYVIPQKDEKALEEAIMVLGSHIPLRESLGKALHTHVHQNFSWENIADKHYTYLKTILP